ncbi:Transposase domain [Paenibacillus sophorae]|uniref:Transposase domain n=1 Tax=Paenibacillus sophorae TaxID=1333845 RepID=A0A1H8SG51_9BACL|nr:Transposase domain [Paenibacillus sophorae]
MLRKMDELVDFSFVYEELQESYCHDNGRTAQDPVQMFKYLLLKSMFDLSDVDLVERSKTDLAFKFFLHMALEEEVIEPSLLTKFRKLRLKDMKLLDLLIGKTVKIAMEKGVIRSRSIHHCGRHPHEGSLYPKDAARGMRERSKILRKAIYTMDKSMKNVFSCKPVTNVIQDEIRYCEQLIAVVEEDGRFTELPKVREPLNLLKETITDDLEHLQTSVDPDAKVGHKSADSSFFGYKTHIAMSDERIITAATITTGEQPDGKQLKTLIEKSKAAGMTVETVIGDTAHSEKDNLAYSERNEIELVSKLNPLITQGNRKKEDEFEFNKDAGMYVCKAGHLATRRARQGKKGKGKNQVDTYYFDVNKCKICPLREGCYKEGAKSKTYSVSLKSDEHLTQAVFQESEAFKAKAKERYKIEAKNSELKRRHGYDVASSSGLVGMEIQGAMAIFVVNLKRILKLLEQ